jgi:hypothetical protein
MKNNRRLNQPDMPSDAIREWRAEAIRGSERSEEFWTLQETKIYARIQRESIRKPRPLWLFAATAALVFLAVLLVSPSAPPTRKPDAVAAVDADQELLLAVERALAARTPQSLAPLTLMVDSSSNNNQADTISHKEQRHEN